MTGSWRRLGRLPLDTSAAPWARTHAALPVIEAAGPAWNVYLSLRDAEGRARIGRTRLVLEPEPALAPLEPEPALDLGELGAFDDNGVTSSCLAAQDGRRYLFYTGWSRGVTVPFYLAAGVAVSDRGGRFVRQSRGPLLDRSAGDPLLTASPWVIVEPDRWRMWYISATAWRRTADGPRHDYHVRYAESPDGRHWIRPGHVCLDYAAPDEHAFARPCVVPEAGGYRMWFAVRGDRYRIEYAESADGLRWQRHRDARGLEPAGAGWDGEMVEYPAVFDWGSRRYMLYNGDGYGLTGVGLAVWVPA